MAFLYSHIPAGFLHDLKDDNAYNENHWLFEKPDVIDSVKNYLISTIFSNLASSTGTATELINLLGSQLPAGNTITNYNLLKESYGY